MEMYAYTSSPVFLELALAHTMPPFGLVTVIL
jgi:hypothetical protein